MNKRQRGSGHYGSKLTEAMVVEALAAIAAGETCKSIGDRMGVNPSVIVRIKNGTAWKHVDRPAPKQRHMLEQESWAAARLVRTLRKRLARAEARLMLVRTKLQSARQEAA